MSEQYRKLKIILNKNKSYQSRVVDEETGQVIIFVSAIDIHLDPKGNKATIVLDNPDIEVEE
jgi:hypothetical protein